MFVDCIFADEQPTCNSDVNKFRKQFLIVLWETVITSRRCKTLFFFFLGLSGTALLLRDASDASLSTACSLDLSISAAASSVGLPGELLLRSRCCAFPGLFSSLPKYGMKRLIIEWRYGQLMQNARRTGNKRIASSSSSLALGRRKFPVDDPAFSTKMLANSPVVFQ